MISQMQVGHRCWRWRGHDGDLVKMIVASGPHDPMTVAQVLHTNIVVTIAIHFAIHANRRPGSSSFQEAAKMPKDVSTASRVSIEVGIPD